MKFVFFNDPFATNVNWYASEVAIDGGGSGGRTGAHENRKV